MKSNWNIPIVSVSIRYAAKSSFDMIIIPIFIITVVIILAWTRCAGRTTRPTWTPASCSKKTAGSFSSSSSSSSSSTSSSSSSSSSSPSSSSSLSSSSLSPSSLRARSIGGVSRRHYGRFASWEQEHLYRRCQIWGALAMEMIWFVLNSKYKICWVIWNNCQPKRQGRACRSVSDKCFFLRC